MILIKPRIRITLNSKQYYIDSFNIVAITGPILLLVTGTLHFKDIINGFNPQYGVDPLGILILFLSMAYLSIYLDTTGFFKYCALLAARNAKKSGIRLFLSLYITISILTIFTSNDIIILTFTPFIFYFAKNANIDPKPYLFMEFCAANTWSMALYIGNPTNIVLSSAFGVQFGEYLVNMILPTIFAGVTSFLLLFIVFHKSIAKPLNPPIEINPKEVLIDPIGVLIGLIILGISVVFLSISPYFGVNIWYAALGSALLLMVIIGIRNLFHSQVYPIKQRVLSGSFFQVMKQMPWTVVPFVLSLFILIHALNISGLSFEIASSFDKFITQLSPMTNHNLTFLYVFFYGITSTLVANFLNNIPMTIAFVTIIQNISPSGILPAVYASIIGSNLGAIVTPIGALAGIMWLSLLKDKSTSFTFWEFIHYGFIHTPLVLLAALAGLNLSLTLF